MTVHMRIKPCLDIQYRRGKWVVKEVIWEEHDGGRRRCLLHPVQYLGPFPTKDIASNCMIQRQLYITALMQHMHGGPHPGEFEFDPNRNVQLNDIADVLDTLSMDGGISNITANIDVEEGVKLITSRGY
jgi:hypothetical protein